MILIYIFREVWGITEIRADFFGYPSSTSYKNLISAYPAMNEELQTYEQMFRSHFITYETCDENNIPIDYDDKAELRDGTELSQIALSAKEICKKYLGSNNVLYDPLDDSIKYWQKKDGASLSVFQDDHFLLTSSYIESICSQLTISNDRKISLLEQLKDTNLQFGSDITSIYRNLPFFIGQFKTLRNIFLKNLDAFELDLTELNNFIQALNIDLHEYESFLKSEEPIWDF